MAPGETVDVERISAETGELVELEPVLMVADDYQVTVGRPAVEGAKVVARVVSHGRGDKVIVFKYKSKVRYRKKTGHRQAYTRLSVEEIVTEKV